MKDYKRFTEKVDSGFVSELDCRIAYNKLCAIEDKIENGTLIELPCKVGDTVYVIDEMENSCGEIVCREVESCIVERISIFDSGVCLGLVDTYGTIKILSNNKVLLTKAKAEAKLKELKGK